MDAIDLSGKPVALYGMDDLSDKVIQLGAEPAGFWLADESYEFEYSRAVIDGVFMGLALDEDNQDRLSAERIRVWGPLCWKISDWLCRRPSQHSVPR